MWINSISSRTIFIWDIHWCYDELMLLIEKINLQVGDIVYTTWDFINKWSRNSEVLNFLYNNRDKISSIIWNNESNLIDYIDWKWNRIYEPFEQLKKELKQKPELLYFLKNLPLFIEKDDFILIHWWIIPWKHLRDHTNREITRTRLLKNWQAWYELYPYNWKKIIYWHWAEKWLTIRNNTIWLDSWCVYWSKLTAYVLETWEIIQVTAKQVYEEIVIV